MLKQILETNNLTLKDHKDKINDVALSQNGNFIASCSNDYYVNLYDQNGQIICSYQHQGFVNSVKISSDSKFVYSASNDCTVKIFDIEKQILIKTIQSKSFLQEITLSKNSELIFCKINPKLGSIVIFLGMSYAAIGMVFNIHDLLIPIQGPGNNLPGTLLFICIGLCLLVVTLYIYMSVIIKYRDIKIYDKEGKLNNSFGQYIEKITVANNEQILATFWKKQITLWDIKQGNEIKKFGELYHKASISSFCFTKDDKHLVSATSAGMIYFWNLENYQPIYSFKAHQGAILDLNYSNDSSMLVSGSVDKSIKIWNSNEILSQQPYLEHFDDQKKILNRVFSENQTMTNEGMYLLKQLNGHHGSIIKVQFSNDDKMIISCSDDGRVILWPQKVDSTDYEKIESKFKQQLADIINKKFDFEQENLDQIYPEATNLNFLQFIILSTIQKQNYDDELEQLLPILIENKIKIHICNGFFIHKIVEIIQQEFTQDLQHLLAEYLIETNQSSQYCQHCCVEEIVFRNDLNENIKLSEFLDNILVTQTFKTNDYYQKSNESIFFEMFKPNPEKLEISLKDNRIKTKSIFEIFKTNLEFSDKMKKCRYHVLYPNRYKLLKHIEAHFIENHEIFDSKMLKQLTVYEFEKYGYSNYEEFYINLANMIVFGIFCLMFVNPQINQIFKGDDAQHPNLDNYDTIKIIIGMISWALHFYCRLIESNEIFKCCIDGNLKRYIQNPFNICQFLGQILQHFVLFLMFFKLTPAFNYYDENKQRDVPSQIGLILHFLTILVSIGIKYIIKDFVLYLKTVLFPNRYLFSLTLMWIIWLASISQLLWLDSQKWLWSQNLTKDVYVFRLVSLSIGSIFLLGFGLLQFTKLYENFSFILLLIQACLRGRGKSFTIFIFSIITWFYSMLFIVQPLIGLDLSAFQVLFVSAKVIFGDFEDGVFSYSDGSNDGLESQATKIMFLIVFLIVAFFVLIYFMNILIAIVSDEYARIMDGIQRVQLFQKLVMVQRKIDEDLIQDDQKNLVMVNQSQNLFKTQLDSEQDSDNRVAKLQRQFDQQNQNQEDRINKVQIQIEEIKNQNAEILNLLKEKKQDKGTSYF